MTTGGAATRKDVTVPLSSATLPSSIPSALSPPPPLPRPRAAQLQAQLAEAVTQAFAGSEARIVAVFEVRREEMREKKRAIDSLSRAKKSSGFALSLSLEGKKKKLQVVKASPSSGPTRPPRPDSSKPRLLALTAVRSASRRGFKGSLHVLKWPEGAAADGAAPPSSFSSPAALLPPSPPARPRSSASPILSRWSRASTPGGEETEEEGASLPSRSRSRRQSGSPGTPASPSSAPLLLPPPRDRPRRR